VCDQERLCAFVPYLEIPRDDDDWRFTQSFTLDDTRAMKAFYDQYGFAVVRDVLSEAECAATREEIWDYVEATSGGGNVSRHDVSTWANWKTKSFGMPGRDSAALWRPQLARNRVNPNIAQAFATVLNEDPLNLRTNHDRWAMYRPIKSAATRDNVHLDINPWQYASGDARVEQRRSALPYGSFEDLHGAENNMISRHFGPHAQGVLNLADNEEADGGFQCVPGFHHHFNRFVHEALGAEPGGAEYKYAFPAGSALHRMAQRVTARAGSLIIWDARLVHGSAPSSCRPGCNPRFAQFIVHRSSALYDGVARDRAALVAELYRAHGLDLPEEGGISSALLGLP